MKKDGVIDRLIWFVGLWLAGFFSLLVVAGLIRWAIV